MKLTALLCISLGSFLPYCQKETNAVDADLPLFDSIPLVKTLNPLIDEISGIADSKSTPGSIWGHEDSGRPPQLYMIKHDGTVSKTIFIKGVSNRDWEDMALSGNEIFIGEIGDNAAIYPSYRIYKFQEPDTSTDTVTQVETINFTYPDGSHDAEAFIVDPITRDIFIITKRDDPSRIYKLAYPYSDNNVLTLVGSLPYMGVVSAAISADGKEIIVKTYTGLAYYKRIPGETIAQALTKNFTRLFYTIEPQGEAISFARNGNGFFTISEKGFSSSVNVYFYKKN
jgi:hypothetical protein